MYTRKETSDSSFSHVKAKAYTRSRSARIPSASVRLQISEHLCLPLSDFDSIKTTLISSYYSFCNQIPKNKIIKRKSTRNLALYAVQSTLSYRTSYLMQVLY